MAHVFLLGHRPRRNPSDRPANTYTYRNHHKTGICIRFPKARASILTAKCLKQADGTVHLYFCGNPENLIMVDNIFHIKINRMVHRLLLKVYCSLVYQVHGTITIPVTLLLSKVTSLGKYYLQVCHVLPE